MAKQFDELLPCDLEVGDVVELVSNVDEGWNTMLVYKVKDGKVHFWRPYGVLSRTVINDNEGFPSVGIEDFFTFAHATNCKYRLMRTREKRQA